MREMIVLLVMAAMRVTEWCMMVLLGEARKLMGKCWLEQKTGLKYNCSYVEC